MKNSQNVFKTERLPIQMVVDTDAGVDDALAITWLLSQMDYPVEVLGFTTVAGNTTVENVTNNVLTLLDALRRPDIPVVVGASAPLSQPLSHAPSFFHGPDGLWFVGALNPHDLSYLPNDVPEFFYQVAHTHPGAKLVALGPLTNLAQAVTRYPDEMRRFEEIIILGGAKRGGNYTPVAEFNFWQDPEAVEQVLAADLPLTLVPFDAFSKFAILQDDIDQLMQKGTPAVQLLAKTLQHYSNVKIQQRGHTVISIPDVAAVMYAVDPNFGKIVESAFVKIVTEQSPARGQSIIGITMREKLPMVVDDKELNALFNQALSEPDFNWDAAWSTISTGKPENAKIVLDIQQQSMHANFMRGLAG